MTEETKATAETKPFEFWAEVRSVVERESGGLTQGVVKHFADKELASRAEKTIQAVEQLASFENQLKKIKPDQELFDANGQLVNSYFSKARLEERRKILEKVDRIEVVLRDVFENNSFDKLKKLNLDKPDANAA